MRTVPRTRRALLVLVAVVLLSLLWPTCLQASELIKWDPPGGPLGGTIKALAISPQNPDLIYAATLNGVFKSTDAGMRWTHLVQGQLQYQEINALAIDPSDDGTVYAGGEEGLFRTIDAGRYWVQLENGLTNDFVLSLAIHPLEPAILYMGAQDGLFKSIDHGNHWAPADHGLPGVSVWSLAIHPTQPYIIYAGTDNGVYVTIDGGENWHSANSGLSEKERVPAIVIDPRPPLVVYATTAQGLYRSTDGGTSWTMTKAASGAVSTIALDPNVENTVYANLGLEAPWKSVTGGDTWLPLKELDPGRLILAMAIHPYDSQQIYLGTDHGFYRSGDGGETWHSSNEGMVGSDVRALVDVPNTRDHLYAATRSGIYQTNDGGRTWQESEGKLDGGNVLALVIDPTNIEIMYAGTWEGAIYGSTNGGASWGLRHGPLAPDIPLTGLVVCPSTRKNVPSTLYAGTMGAGVLCSRDYGRSWESLAADLPTPRVAAIWRTFGKRPYVYVGAGKEVYRLAVSTDSQEKPTWERVTDEPLNGYVTDGLADPDHRGRIYVCTDAGGVYCRKNEDSTFKNLANESVLSSLKVERLILLSSKGSSQLLCALTSGGLLFYTYDQGDIWSLNTTGSLHRTRVRCIAIDDRAPGVLYVGTAKSGVYRGVAKAEEDTSQSILPWLGFLLLAAIPITWFIMQRRKAKHSLEQKDVFERNWERWDEMITDALVSHHHVSPEMLEAIPAQERFIAMRRYVGTHQNQALIFREDPLSIKPAKNRRLERFVSDWGVLVDRLDNPMNATPIATRITEQLSGLLGFSLLMNRTFKSLSGYMVKAPTVRLSIPPYFPIIFVLKSEMSEEDIRDVRNLMRVLNATSFFALLIVVSGTPYRREQARDLKRLISGGADDFIVLDYRDLYRLFLATDADHYLMDLILDQVDLTIVSPYVVAGPVSGKMFFGRDYEMKAIMRTIQDRSFAIVGGRKIGKTSVLTKVQELMEQTSDLSAFYLDCQHLTNYQEFFGSLALKCQVQIGSTSPDELRRVMVRLRRQHGGDDIVLLLDEVDRLLAFDMQQQVHLFRVFRALSQEGLCRFVFCGERQLHGALHDPDSPLFNFCNILRLSYLQPRHALRIIQEPMAEMGVIFEDPETSPEDIIELSGCHPNLVQAICQMLIVRMNARGTRMIRTDDLAQVRASDEFRDFFFEVTWGNATTLERLITVLMVNRPSFALSDVAQALAWHDCDTSNTQIEKALTSLELFSILRKQGNRYTFASRSFAAIMIESDLVETFRDGALEELKAKARRPQQA